MRNLVISSVGIITPHALYSSYSSTVKLKKRDTVSRYILWLGLSGILPTCSAAWARSLKRIAAISGDRKRDVTLTFARVITMFEQSCLHGSLGSFLIDLQTRHRKCVWADLVSVNSCWSSPPPGDKGIFGSYPRENSKYLLLQTLLNCLYMPLKNDDQVCMRPNNWSTSSLICPNINKRRHI